MYDGVRFGNRSAGATEKLRISCFKVRPEFDDPGGVGFAGRIHRVSPMEIQDIAQLKLRSSG